MSSRAFSIVRALLAYAILVRLPMRRLWSAPAADV